MKVSGSSALLFLSSVGDLSLFTGVSEVDPIGIEREKSLPRVVGYCRSPLAAAV